MIYNTSITNLSVNQGTHYAYYDLAGGVAFSGGDDPPPFRGKFLIYEDAVQNGFVNVKEEINIAGDAWSLSGDSEILPNGYPFPTDDTGWSWATAIQNKLSSVVLGAEILTIAKTAAVTGTAGTPSQYQAQSAHHTAYIRAAFTPATLTSTATVWIDYKRTADPWGYSTSTTTGQSGYDSINFDRTITGLQASTSYDFRLRMTRDTVNETSATSSTYTFTTMAGVPTVVTDGASNHSNASATLNATLDTNTTSTDVTFQWGPAANHTQFETSPAFTWSTDGDKAVSKGITGLAASTTYYFRAKAVHAGGTVYGSEASFSTTADPAIEAAEEARMQPYEYKRKYGVILTASPIFFTLQTPSGTNSNTFVVGATVLAADCLISKDCGAFTQTTNQPVTLGNGYTLVLTAAEMAANEIDVIIKDAAAGPDFRDCHLRVITHIGLGTVDIDPSTGSKGTNTIGLTILGRGTGAAISATGGTTSTSDIAAVMRQGIQDKGTLAAATSTTDVTLAGGSVATADYYKGSILVFTGGTGAGQCRLITAYAANKRATLGRALLTAASTDTTYIVIPGPDVWTDVSAELAALPVGDGGSFGTKLQGLFQRFFYKRDQTASNQQLYKANSSTVIATSTITDSSGTQIIGKAS